MANQSINERAGQASKVKRGARAGPCSYTKESQLRDDLGLNTKLKIFSMK